MSGASLIELLTDEVVPSAPSLNDEIHSRVIAELAQVFRHRNLSPPPLGPETVLDASLGLESLDFAELVLRLEQVFGHDPFSRGAVPEVATIRDLAALYR